MVPGKCCQIFALSSTRTMSDDVGSMFEKMSRLLETVNDAQEKERLMIGMTGVPDKDILHRMIYVFLSGFFRRSFDFRYLERATDETFIRGQDFATLLIKIAMNPVGLDVAWNFVRSRWETLLVKYERNEYTLGNIVCTVVSLFKDREKLREEKENVNSFSQATQFFREKADLKVTENAKRNAIEEIENNIDWLDANSRSIEQWLSSNGFD
ncbi:hypothetical protein E2986_07861 [Frieseomelitta varia]|uniref:ERAP1-like C-terminal domain-containing protein n=1 Tax=Frieseomelitta varia TaxID=561572 RepID=A0A833S6W5_9HYME|nr:hypothetical protein E2986_07861 [Frieseomelitta varia]